MTITKCIREYEDTISAGNCAFVFSLFETAIRQAKEFNEKAEKKETNNVR